MSEAAKPAAGKGKLVGRIVIYALLGVACVVVGMDYSKKRAAAQTANVLHERRESTDKGELQYEEAKTLFVGEPTISREDIKAPKHSALYVETLTWTGPIKEHSIKIYLGLPKTNPAINYIEGPGEEAQPE